MLTKTGAVGGDGGGGVGDRRAGFPLRRFAAAGPDLCHSQNRHVRAHTLHPTPYTLNPTPYTLQPTPYTLHPTPYTQTFHPRNPNPSL